MGCNSSIALQSFTQLAKVQSKIGTLTIAIENCKLSKQITTANILPFIKLKMSNQQRITKVSYQGGKNHNFDQTVQFCINSQYKIYGRTIVIQLWDSNPQAPCQQMGMGLIDINPYLKFDNYKNFSIKSVALTQNRKTISHINLRIKFQQCPSSTLSLKINSAFIRLYTKSKRMCTAKITIGQQIFQTSPKLDSGDIVPCWKKQVKTFEIPSFLQEGIIQIIEKGIQSDIVLGQTKINLRKMVWTNQELMHNQPLYINETITGAISFDSIAGNNNGQALRQINYPINYPSHAKHSNSFGNQQNVVNHNFNKHHNSLQIVVNSVNRKSKVLNQNQNVYISLKQTVSQREGKYRKNSLSKQQIKETKMEDPIILSYQDIMSNQISKKNAQQIDDIPIKLIKVQFKLEESTNNNQFKQVNQLKSQNQVENQNGKGFFTKSQLFNKIPIDGQRKMSIKIVPVSILNANQIESPLSIKQSIRNQHIEANFDLNIIPISLEDEIQQDSQLNYGKQNRSINQSKQQENIQIIYNYQQKQLQ